MLFSFTENKRDLKSKKVSFADKYIKSVLKVHVVQLGGPDSWYNLGGPVEVEAGKSFLWNVNCKKRFRFGYIIMNIGSTCNGYTYENVSY